MAKKSRFVIKELDRSIDFDDIPTHRHINCERYGKCLNKASRKNWTSFSCVKCPIFKEYRAIREDFIDKFINVEYLKEGVTNGAY